MYLVSHQKVVERASPRSAELEIFGWLRPGQYLVFFGSVADWSYVPPLAEVTSHLIVGSR